MGRHREDLARFWKKAWKPLTLVITLPVVLQWQANRIAERSYQLQITPRLSVEIRHEPVQVGPTPSRIDEVVCIPITVFNNSDAYALDVEFDVLISRSHGHSGVSINDYLRTANKPVPHWDRLEKGQAVRLPIEWFCPSVINNATELYKAGKEKCNIKVQLTWTDIEGKPYRLVTLAELVWTAPLENNPGYFWFKPKGTYSSFDNPKEIEAHWGLPFQSSRSLKYLSKTLLKFHRQRTDENVVVMINPS